MTHIFIYEPTVSVEEVVPKIIKKKECERLIPTLPISWTAIHSAMKNRSVDDIRNFWQMKLLPILVPSSNKLFNQTWTEEQDKDLLLQIFDQDVENDKDIDFDAIDNERTAQENLYRWTILLKGLGSVMPGQRFKVGEIVQKMVHDIETKAERYVPFESKTGASSRNGRNQFISIVEYFRKHFSQ